MTAPHRMATGTRDWERSQVSPPSGQPGSRTEFNMGGTRRRRHLARLTWDQFGEALSAYERWNFRLLMEDRSADAETETEIETEAEVIPIARHRRRPEPPS